MPKITIKFEPRDLWVGVYWDYYVHPKSAFTFEQLVTLDIYVCLLPMIPIRFRWEREK